MFWWAPRHIDLDTWTLDNDVLQKEVYCHFSPPMYLLKVSTQVASWEAEKSKHGKHWILVGGILLPQIKSECSPMTGRQRRLRSYDTAANASVASLVPRTTADVHFISLFPPWQIFYGFPQLGRSRPGFWVKSFSWAQKTLQKCQSHFSYFFPHVSLLLCKYIIGA